MRPIDSHAQPVTVFYDGACPLCVREIALLRRLVHGSRVQFEDVSPPDASPSCPIDRTTLMARFHARLPDGSIVSGARAFTESWGRVRYLGWLRPVGAFAPSRWLLDGLYRVFLVVRPALQTLVRKLERRPG